MINLAESIERKYEPEPNSGCWIWKHAINRPNGYGIVWDGIKTRKAHRVLYEMFVGPIPPGKELDHLCRVRHCVNPKHLEPVTRRENLRRSPLVMALTCPSGHAYDLTLKNGWRRCRTCDLTKRNNRRRARIAAGLPRGS